MITLLPSGAFLSETSRMIEIARALSARNVPFTLASHGGPYSHLMDEAGLAWDRLEPVMNADAAQRFVAAVIAMGTSAEHALHEDSYLKEAAQAEAAYFRQRGTKLALIGFNLPSYLSTRLAGIPLASSHGGAFVPPALEHGLCPAPVNPAEPKMAKLPLFLQRWLANRVPRWLRSPVKDLNRVAQELGVSGVPSLIALMCADLTLVTETPEVLGIAKETLEAWRPTGRSVWPSTRMRYVGPLFAKLDMPLPARVASFLQQENCVYVAPTSVTAAFVRGLVHAVRNAGARVLVASTVHELRDLESEDVMVEGILPSHLVMPRVKAAIIMGGQGSVQTAIASATPFVGMPLHGEQELNVACAERLGMAIRLSPTAAATPAITAAVRRLLHEATFHAAAIKASEQYNGLNGADACALALREYLENGPA